MERGGGERERGREEKMKKAKLSLYKKKQFFCSGGTHVEHAQSTITSSRIQLASIG